jgi:hypothetical protein
MSALILCRMIEFYRFICCNEKRKLCWNFRTIYGVQKPSRNRIVAPARQSPYL